MINRVLDDMQYTASSEENCTVAHDCLEISVGIRHQGELDATPNFRVDNLAVFELKFDSTRQIEREISMQISVPTSWTCNPVSLKKSCPYS
jgi:hypothetical protein